MTSGFRAWGHTAWWRGLSEARRKAEERVRASTTDEERRQAQSELEALKTQAADAKSNGHRRLY